MNIQYNKQMQFVSDMVEGMINDMAYEDLHDMRIELMGLVSQLENKQWRLYRERCEKDKKAI